VAALQGVSELSIDQPVDGIFDLFAYVAFIPSTDINSQYFTYYLDGPYLQYFDQPIVLGVTANSVVSTTADSLGVTHLSFTSGQDYTREQTSAIVDHNNWSINIGGGTSANPSFGDFAISNSYSYLGLGVDSLSSTAVYAIAMPGPLTLAAGPGIPLTSAPTPPSPPFFSVIGEVGYYESGSPVLDQSVADNSMLGDLIARESSIALGNTNTSGAFIYEPFYIVDAGGHANSSTPDYAVSPLQNLTGLFTSIPVIHGG
jgi:hypothetical protein